MANLFSEEIEKNLSYTYKFNDGDLRVWCMRAYADETRHTVKYLVDEPLEALVLIKTLFKKEDDSGNIIFNVFGLEVYKYGQWSNWYDDNMNSITDYTLTNDGEMVLANTAN